QRPLLLPGRPRRFVGREDAGERPDVRRQPHEGPGGHGFEAPTGEDRRRASTRVADGVVQAQFPDALPGLGSADDEGLRADVDRPRGEVRGLKRATDPGRRLVHVDPCLRQLTPELVGGGQPTDTAADHRDPGRRHYFPVSSWTRSTTWVTAPGSVAG